MRSTSFIVATTVVIAATLNYGAEGFPRPQTNIGDGSTIFMVDGFAFDGPASGLKPSEPGSGLLRGTPAPVDPMPFPIVTPNPPTPPQVVDPTPSAGANVTPTPATVQPGVAQCAQNCQVTSEYNPVCGSDGVMYNNAGTLVCARNCGINVTQLHLGRCSTPNLRG